MSIRVKIALPFLLLTVVVSVIGVYVVTRLVTGSLAERLTNQLLESGRVVSDSFIRQEELHVTEALRVVYTVGLSEAVSARDKESVLRIVGPAFGSGTVENMILISEQGGEVLHLLRGEDGKVIIVEQDTGAGNSPIVTPFLESRNPSAPPRRSLGSNFVNKQLYYYTALPVAVDNNFSGVILVGTSIDTLLPEFKRISLADVVVYSPDGQALATTLGSNDEETLSQLDISQDEYLKIISTTEDLVTGVNVEVVGRLYTIGRAPLQIGKDRIAVFAVALPADFVVQFGANNRIIYTVIFSALMLAVVIIGLLVARKIIAPLYSLVDTTQAITSGNLNRRTDVHTGDEIETLADRFDEMTARLQERTIQLEEKNETLKKIDKTKTNFIQISAHELRTPLTLIMGYSQMLEQDLKKDPELQKLAQGILEGAERMTDVVDSMLDVSRIDSNSLVLRKASVQIEPIIRRVQKEFEPAFKERGINFNANDLEKLPSISADPEMLKKVFYHLVMNAIKYTPDGGNVKISGRYINGFEPPQLEVTVSDTGIGVDQSMHELIFQKFHQTGEVLLHSSGKTKFKGGGPGLGLAIARGIILAHGGRLWVESPGHDEEKMPGSKFIVSLPAQKKESGS
jgi:signal transduction histidine kinase